MAMFRALAPACGCGCRAGRARARAENILAVLALVVATAAQAAPGRALRGAANSSVAAGAAADAGAAGGGAAALAAMDGPGALFAALDADGDGGLSRQEVLTATWVDRQPTEMLFEAADADGSGAISPEEFRAVAATLSRRQQREAPQPRLSWEQALLSRAAAVRAAFRPRRQAAVESNGTRKELEDALENAGENASSELIDAILNSVNESDIEELVSELNSSSGESLDQAVGDKNIWTPSEKCEMYTLKSCGPPLAPGWPNRTCYGVSTCSKDGDCMCPSGYCSSTRIGHCQKCEDELAVSGACDHTYGEDLEFWIHGGRSD